MVKEKLEQKSIAEMQGRRFEERCESALAILQLRWEMIQIISEDYLERRHAQMQMRDERLAKLEDEGTRRDMTALIKHLAALDAEDDERFFQKTWEDGKQFVREVLGSDAVDFALKAMEKERSGS